jgi:hypothetical protein
MHESGRARRKKPPSFFERLPRNALIVAVFSTGLFLLVSYMRQSRIEQQVAANNDLRQTSKAENGDGP